MKKKELIKFFDMTSDIMLNQEYLNLRNEKHHGINRFDHSLRVAKYTYFFSKLFKINVRKATRGAMLHDFYTMQEVRDSKKMGSCVHPLIAAQNAGKYYELDVSDINIIESHMFPLGKTVPKSKEAWLVDIVDTMVASYELTKFKFNGYLALYFIFFLNIIIFKK